MTGRRGKEEKNLFGSSAKTSKKKAKNVQSRRLAVNKKVEEVREQNRFRVVEG
jgi:hypothetical protein